MEGTTEQPALSGGTIIMHSGKLSATAAEGGQLAGTDLELLLNDGVSGDNLSGAEVQDNGLVKYTATQLNSLTSLTLTTPAKYTVAMAEDAGEGWTIAPAEATTDGVTKDTEITATYNGTRHVKSVTAVVKAKPAANVATAPTATADVTAGTTTALVSATVPTAESLAAGTYYVWYYVQADDTHSDSEISATAIEVTVKAATPAYSPTRAYM